MIFHGKAPRLSGGRRKDRFLLAPRSEGSLVPIRICRSPEEFLLPTALGFFGWKPSVQYGHRTSFRAGDRREEVLHGSYALGLADLLEFDLVHLDPVVWHRQIGIGGVRAVGVGASGHRCPLLREKGSPVSQARAQFGYESHRIDSHEHGREDVVCSESIQPDSRGKVRLEGVTHSSAPKAWIWGPVPYHDECRTKLQTPYDDLVGRGEHILTWQKMTA